MMECFHSPEWHAARLRNLQTSNQITWEEWKRKQKEEAQKKQELNGDEARLMREYRAQLDAERAQRLARGRNHADKREKLSSKKKKKDKEKTKNNKKHKKREREKRHRSRDDSSDSESDSSTSSSEDEKRKERRKLKKDKKRKKRRRRESSSRTDYSSSDRDSRENSVDASGPLPLSAFFENGR
ncbi:hypothetical protein CBR_g6538 [Chara braunii]|uniref:Uncharacterized protein n=1 Tax=Chara braunii TaxID=69332 RepID=A0A388KK30_CHABU|nr:hypothetical protein CBR_g6538 [Chara braunii]|eukprot:GBG70411.1 hypothetical protein CBR_g6538 [Chara braunii]